MKQWYIPWQCVVAGVLGLSGCVDAGATIQVLRNQLPEEGCIVPTNLGSTFLPRGRIEVTAAAGYLFTPVVENRAESTETVERLVFAEGANVDLKFERDFFSNAEIDGFNDAGLARFRQALSGSMAPGSVTSYAFEVIPKAMLEEIGGKLADGESTQVIAEVVVIGDLEGNEVKSNTFSYPIEVCKGCLLTNLGSCEDIGDIPINTGGVCQALQDGFLDCCTDPEGALVCPAQKPAGPV